MSTSPLLDSPRRSRVTLGGIMLAVMGVALILGLLRAAPVAGAILLWLATVLGAVEAMARWRRLSRARAAVAVLAIYPWITLSLLLLALGMEQTGNRHSAWVALLNMIAGSFALGSPFAAIACFHVGLMLVAPTYERGESIREADAGRLLGFPLASWLTFFVIMALTWTFWDD